MAVTDPFADLDEQQGFTSAAEDPFADLDPEPVPPARGQIASDQAKYERDFSFGERLGHSWGRGYEGFRAGGALDRALQAAEDTAPRQEPQSLDEMTEDPLGVRFDRRTMESNVQDVVERNQRLAKIPQNPVTKAAMEADTFGAALEAVGVDPISFISDTFLSSLPHMADSVILGAAGSLAAGPAGAMAGGGYGSFAADYRGQLLEGLAEAGVDTSSVASIIEALDNPGLMEQIKKSADAHAAVVGAVDALSMGVAGKSIPKSWLPKNRVAAGAAELGAGFAVQGAMGAAGEAGGQVSKQMLAEGKEWDAVELKPGEILAEALAEGATMPIEAAIMAIREPKPESGEKPPESGDINADDVIGDEEPADDVASPGPSAAGPNPPEGSGPGDFVGPPAIAGPRQPPIPTVDQVFDRREGDAAATKAADEERAYDEAGQKRLEERQADRQAAAAARRKLERQQAIDDGLVDPEIDTGALSGREAALLDDDGGTRRRGARFSVRREEAVDEAAATAIPEPTDGQKEAGNYRKGHVRLHGLDISIENPAGSMRSGTDADGAAWSQEMKSHYGYVKGTTGFDKDHVDVFLGPLSTAQDLPVYVVNQNDPKTGKFDEHKAMIGYPNRDAAVSGYQENYAEGWAGMDSVVEMTMDEFKAWAKSSEPKKGPAKVRPEDQPAAISEAQTKTPEFKRWFGDSEVVDEAGRPMVLFHGTSGDFREFDGARYSGGPRGIFATADPSEAARFASASEAINGAGPNIIPIFMRAENLADLSSPESIEDVSDFLMATGQIDEGYALSNLDESSVWRAFHGGDESFIDAMISAGFDGAKFLEPDSGSTTYVAFSNDQVKSAVGNNGDFDPANPSIIAQSGRSGLAVQESEGTPSERPAIKVSTNPSIKSQESWDPKFAPPPARGNKSSPVAMADFYDPRGVDSRKTLTAAIEDILAAGFPRKVIDSIKTIGSIHESSSLRGAYWPGATVIGIRSDILSAAASGGRMGEILRQYLVHELSHHIDYAGFEVASSHQSPAFNIDPSKIEITQTGIRLNKGSLGPVIKELFRIYDRNHGGLGLTLGYPFDQLPAAVASGDQARIKTIQSEAFAQLSALYYNFPATLKQHAPEGYALMEKINAHLHDDTGPARDPRVREEIRGTGADGGQPGLRPAAAGIQDQGSAQRREAGGGVEGRPAERRRDELDDHTQVIEKTARATVQGRLTAEESAALKGAPKSLIQQAREYVGMFPAREGWHRPVVTGWRMTEVEGKDGKIRTKAEVTYQTIKYAFDQDPSKGRAYEKTAEARAQKLAKKVAAEINQIKRKAEAGDRNAQVQMRQARWYRGMREQLRAGFGGIGDLFADLLGATSPNTPVPTNWNFAIEALRRFTSGEYDTVMPRFVAYARRREQAQQALVDYVAEQVEAGRTKKAAKEDAEYKALLEAYQASKEYDGPVPTRPVGDEERKYGINSGNVASALGNLWRIVRGPVADAGDTKGMAPKAKNFSGNLIGLTDNATIDVWAARFLQRLAGEKRVPPAAEGSVGGNYATGANKIGDKVGGQFGFGQRVFEIASELTGIGADELQAIVWFREKELWVSKGWSLAEGGSFEQQFDQTDPTRYQAGASITVDEIPPDSEMAKARARLDKFFGGLPGLIAHKAVPTFGRYMGSDERAFDIELVADKGFDPTPVVAEMARFGRDYNQVDVFVSRVLRSSEQDSPAARPGVEIYFSDLQSYQDILPKLEAFTSREADGFTFITDLRATPDENKGKTPDGFVGIRIQYVPEFAARYDEEFRQKIKDNPGAISDILMQKAEALMAAAGELKEQAGITSAELVWYDTLVMGKENYGAYDQAEESGDLQAPAGEAWFGSPVREALEAAIGRYEAGERGGPVPGSDQARAEADREGAPAGIEEDQRARKKAGQGSSRRADVITGDALVGDGRGFTSFFANVTKGLAGRSSTGRPYEPVITAVQRALQREGSFISRFAQIYGKYRGNFDDHIAFSIPGHRDLQIATGAAVVKTVGTGRVLDLGASEGSWIKAITELSDGKVETLGVDPNPSMAEHFEKTSVPGSEYQVTAFAEADEAGQVAWTEDDGTEIRNMTVPDGGFDLVHESMVFQFISNARNAQIRRMKELLKPGGLALFEQKVFDRDDAVFNGHEDKKDFTFKRRYFSQDEIEQKRQLVLNRGGDEVEGMNDLMVFRDELEDTLRQNFRFVAEYWSSGNFVGYAGSDSKQQLESFLDNLADTDSDYAARPTPRPLYSVKRLSADTGAPISGDPIEALRASFEQELGRPVPAGAFSKGSLPARTLAALKAIGAIFGKDIVIFRAAEGYDITDGLILPEDPNTIYISSTSTAPHLVVLGHELLHQLRIERPDIYATLLDELIPLMDMQRVGEYQDEINRIRRREGLDDLDSESIVEELVADTLGDRLIEPEFWKRLAGKNPSMFRAVLDTARRLINRILAAMKGDYGSSKAYRDMERVRDVLAAAVGEYATNPRDVVAAARAKGYEGIKASEAREWLGAIKKGLDMSKEARMERARAMGFDVDTIWYHGSRSAGFRAFDTSKGQSAGEAIFLANDKRRAGTYSGTMDPAPLYSGEELFDDPDVIDNLEIETVYVITDENGNQIVDEVFEREEDAAEWELDPGERIEPRYTVYWQGYEEVFAGSRDEAIMYLDELEPSQPGIYELLVRAEDVWEIDWKGRGWDNAPPEEAWRILNEDGDLIDYAYSAEEAEEVVAGKDGWEIEEPDPDEATFETTNDKAAEARDMGVDAVIFRDVVDDGGAAKWAGDGDVMVVFDPRRIRSVDAAFDPGWSDSSNLLASMGEAPIYYSQLSQVLREKLPGKGDGKTLAAMVESWAKKGQIKQEELDWVGLLEWLREQKAVTKQQVLDWMGQNQVEVREVVREGAAPEQDMDQEVEVLTQLHDQMNAEWDVEYDEDEGGYLAYDRNGEPMRNTGGDLEVFESERYAKDAIGEEVGRIVNQMTYEEQRERLGLPPVGPGPAAPTRYDEYQLPGGENYREVLLTLPVKRQPTAGKKQMLANGKWRVDAPGGNITLHDDEGAANAEMERLGQIFAKESFVDTSDQYRSTHWDEPNILAHVRFNERTDADGKRVLFIEEVQSDWHQEGRRHGYANSHKKRYAVYSSIGRRVDDFDTRAEAERAVALFIDGAEIREEVSSEKVPNAPFKKSWTLLAMKRMIRWAVDNGFDRVAWLPGKEQSERYSLSRAIKHMGWTTIDDKSKFVSMLLTSNVVAQIWVDGAGTVTKIKGAFRDMHLTGKPFSELVGVDVAKKVLSETEGEMSDFSVGAEGMIGFYDKILPAEVGKYVKKWGAKVGSTRVPTKETKRVTEWQDEPAVDQPFAVLHEDDRSLLRAFDTREEAERYAAGHHIVVETGAGAERGVRVHAFDVTDKMREGASQSQPMFRVRRPKYSVRRQPPGGQAPSESIFQALKDGQPVDFVFRAPFEVAKRAAEAAGVTPKAKQAAGAAVGAMKKFYGERMPWLHPVIDTAAAGLIDRYKLPKEYILKDERRMARKRQLLQTAVELIEEMSGIGINSIEEAKAFHAILTGASTGGTVQNASWNALSQKIRDTITQLGEEAVDLGLISEESFNRNKASYLHRVYQKYEADKTGVAKFVDNIYQSRAKKLKGDAFKGRGLFKEVDWKRVMKDSDPKASAVALPGDVGKKFTILDKVGEVQTSGKYAGKRRVDHRVYWPAGQPIPEKYAGYTNKGTFEVRSLKGTKVVLWRDFTQSEREAMGEITDARYTLAKTFRLMAHDIATGEFLRDIASNPAWTWPDDENPPEGALDARGGLLDTATGSEWVKVPETTIPKSGGKKRWGALAGKYVRSEIWRDLNQIEQAQRRGLWDSLLTFWKLNKTARNPVTHMNNVMSNFILADMADVRVLDVWRGLVSIINKDDAFKQAEAMGAFGHSFIEQEIQRDVLDPILRELGLTTRGGKGAMEAEVERVLQGLPMHKQIAFLAKILETIWAGKMIDVGGKQVNVGIKSFDAGMQRLYQVEDEVFRMATFLRRLEQGMDPEEAAHEAREGFLNYDIRAPWINAMRRSFWPFLSYTYRAVPIVAQNMLNRPWKLAKYFTLAYGMQALAYALSGDDEDDEDRQRKAIRDEAQGHTWIGLPRMLRWWDPVSGGVSDDGDPLYIDIRRWIPAGDVFDTNQGQAALEIVPAPLVPGGPVPLAVEFLWNKLMFTGKEITDEDADTTAMKVEKTLDWLWKSWAPGAPWIPGSWYWEKIDLATKGARDRLGREYDIGDAVMSSFGIKIQPLDVDYQLTLKLMEIDRKRRAIGFGFKKESERHHLGQLDDSEYEKIKARRMEQLGQLREKARELNEAR